MPGPYNRKGDSWRLMFAMAELTGDKWLDKVTAVVTLLADTGGENESPGVLLLADIRRIFKQVKHDDLPSNHLVEHLAAMPERPWSEFKYGKPITPRQVADLLRPFVLVLALSAMAITPLRVTSAANSKRLFRATLKAHPSQGHKLHHAAKSQIHQAVAKKDM